MSVTEVSTTEAVENINNSRIAALSAMSWVYKGLLKATSLGVAATENSLGRVTTLSYTTKSIHAKLGALKDVKVDHIAGIMLDDKKSFKEKLRESISHVRQNFSHETTVAFGMDFVKHGIGLAVGIGVGTLLAVVAPAAMAVTVGAVASTSAVMATKYYLATHAGHGAESKIANGIHHMQEACVRFLKGTRNAVKGQDPEMNQVVAMADKMMEEHGHGHGHGHHGHGHGHGHHHEKFHHTLIQDLKNLIHPTHMKHSTSKFVQNMKAEGSGLKEHIKTQKNALLTQANDFYSKINAPKVTPAQDMKKEGVTATVEDSKPQVASKKPQNNSPKM